MSGDLRTRLANIDGVEESDSAFKDTPGYWVNGKEILHFEASQRSTSASPGRSSGNDASSFVPMNGYGYGPAVATG